MGRLASVSMYEQHCIGKLGIGQGASAIASKELQGVERYSICNISRVLRFSLESSSSDVSG